MNWFNGAINAALVWAVYLTVLVYNPLSWLDEHADSIDVRLTPFHEQLETAIETVMTEVEVIA